MTAKEYRDKEAITDANFWNGNEIDFDAIYEFAEDYHNAHHEESQSVSGRADKVLDYLLHHVEDFGDAKYTRTGELQCVGHLSYGCVNMAVAMNVIKIMEGKKVENVKSSYKEWKQLGYDALLAPVNVRWIPLTEKEPEEGFEVLLYNKNWINEDWNPKGVRVGYLGGVGGWISAYWCNYHDDYHTRTSDEDDKQFEDYKAENQVPTHWMEIPACVG